MIKLKRLPMTDLNPKYARLLENNVIKHYTVPIIASMVQDTSNDELVKFQVSKELGITPEEVQIEEPKQRDAPFARTHLSLLKNHKKIKKELEKIKTNSMLYKYTDNTLLERFITKLGNILNPIIRRLNKFVGIPEIPCLVFRKVTPCSFLALTYEESDREEAEKILLNDLKTLSDKGLIMGHLMMPTEFKLANNIGSDQDIYCLACFIFVDYYKMHKILNTTPYTLKKLPLNNHLGLKTEVFDGSADSGLTGLHPNKKYTVEETSVVWPDKVDIREEVIKAYNEGIELSKANRVKINALMGSKKT